MNSTENIDGGPVWYRNTPPNLLGESPIYRACDSTLHWIDCYSTPCAVHILTVDPSTGEAIGRARILEVPFGRITSIYFRKGTPGSYICGYQQGIALLDEKTGGVVVLKELIKKEDSEAWAMNDGGVDPQGRFWIGEVDMKALFAKMGGKSLPEGYGSPRGRLWRYEADGTCTIMDTGIGCGNGIGWSPDGKCMYFNDSVPQITWRYDFDRETGKICNKMKIIGDLPQGVLNDGCVVDQEGNLWVAMFMLNCVMVYTPEGSLLKTIRFPAKLITCPTWGGRGNDILFITSAQPLPEDAAPGDEGGHVFRYKTELKGMAKHEFAG
ncbi:hypothetical protein DL95DRAFT_477914 [Leptodontidium sp. 2 PMI_412]|nr:hypothetical protein DL95DRAFT_477914 [Leptodontidium sp. 2 PMI_412]